MKKKQGKRRRGLCFLRGKEERIPIDSRVSALLQHLEIIIRKINKKSCEV